MKRRTREPEPEAGGGYSELMTLHQVADYLHCHYITAYRLIHRGELPAFRVGSDWRFRRIDLDKWIAQQHLPMAPSEPSRPARYKRKS